MDVDLRTEEEKEIDPLLDRIARSLERSAVAAFPTPEQGVDTNDIQEFAETIYEDMLETDLPPQIIASIMRSLAESLIGQYIRSPSLVALSAVGELISKVRSFKEHEGYYLKDLDANDFAAARLLIDDFEALYKDYRKRNPLAKGDSVDPEKARKRADSVSKPSSTKKIDLEIRKADDK